MAANTFTATGIIPRLLAMALPILRQSAFMPKLVNRKFETSPGAKYSTIDIPIYSAITATDVTPGPTPPAMAALAPTSVPISVDTWKTAGFAITDKEMLQVGMGIIPGELRQATIAIANAVNASLMALYKQIPTVVGTAGVTPFGTDLAEIIDARKALNRQLAPKEDRRVVLNSDAMANALLLAQVSNQSWRSNPAGIIEGQVARTMGFDWFEDESSIPSHVGGSITTGLIAKAATAVAAGLKTFVATTAAGSGAIALKVGDIIGIAGHTQTYTLTADATEAGAATDEALFFEPGLQFALVGSEAVTLQGVPTQASNTAAVNLAFHRDAFALVSRPFAGADPFNLGIFDTIVDEESGLVLRLETSREYYQSAWRLDCLYGVGLPMPAYATRLNG